MEDQDKQLVPSRLDKLLSTQMAPQSSEGLEDFPDSQVAIPRLILGQPGNRSDLEPGMFNDNLSGATYESMNVVLIKMSRGRTLWPKGVPGSKDKPQCRSADAKVPDQDFYGKLCQRCNDVHQLCVEYVDGKENIVCPHSKWTNEKPDCRLSYQLLLASIDTGQMYILNLTGTSIAPTNRLLSSYRVQGKPAYSASFRICLLQSDDKRYYKIKYADFKWLESPDVLKKLFEKFKARPITPNQEQEEQSSESLAVSTLGETANDNQE